MIQRYATKEDIADAAQAGRWAVIEGVEHDETIVETFPTKAEAEQVVAELNKWVSRTSDEIFTYRVGEIHAPESEQEQEESRD